jgi:VWFA-related protein
MRVMKQFPVVLLLCVIGLTALAQDPQFTIKVESNLVNVLCTVTDRKGRLIPNLTKDDFMIEEDGKKQEIVSFSKENELPLTLALLIDTSGSVRDVLSAEKETASAFINSILTPRDLAMVIKFDKYAKVIQDFTESKRRMADAIDQVGPTGNGTALYDALVLAARDHLSLESGRKAMILISDGDDQGSSHRLNDALFSAQSADSIIYSISNIVDGSQMGKGPDTLKRLSGDTGGAVFFIRRSSDFKGIFDTIASELRGQYSVAYKSTNTARDGKFRNIKVLPKEASMMVRARKGYFGPTD